MLPFLFSLLFNIQISITHNTCSGNPIATATVTVNPVGQYIYRIDNKPWQRSNVFKHIATGGHVVTVYGVGTISFIVVGSCCVPCGELVSE